jgi:uncharacterized DUF497 family protein
MFSWDADKARKNYEKYGVTFEEAATAFGDSDALEAEDMENPDLSERRWKRLAFSIRNRLLLVIYTFRRLSDGTETIRIISARQATRNERKIFAGQ